MDKKQKANLFRLEVSIYVEFKFVWHNHKVLALKHLYFPFVLRVSLDESNLVITDVNRGDEGNYTCVFKNELDQKSASAHLLVMGMTNPNRNTFIMSNRMLERFEYLLKFFFLDRPNPPTDLELSDPFERSVRLSWVPGDSNHSPITGKSCTTYFTEGQKVVFFSVTLC